MIFPLIASLIGVLPKFALDGLQTYLNRKVDINVEREQTDRAVALKKIDEEIAARNAHRDILIAEQGWWVTAWIRPLFAYLILLHFGAIVLDTVFGFGWGIPKLPAPFDEYEGWIIAAYFIGRPVEKVAKALIRR